MSREELYRYAKLITDDRLPVLVNNPGATVAVQLGMGADLGDVRSLLGELLRRDTTGRSKQDRAVWDRELVEPLHQALRLSRRDAADMRFWHWLCIAVLPEFVWARWLGQVPSAEQVEEALSNNRAMAGRFLGSASLNGVSRNALARLWWCAETLSNGGTDYSLVREALTYQDLFQAIFERRLGLYPPTARVLLRVCRNNTSEAWRREAIKRLNHSFTTIVAEALDEAEIERLVGS